MDLPEARFFIIIYKVLFHGTIQFKHQVIVLRGTIELDRPAEKTPSSNVINRILRSPNERPLVHPLLTYPYNFSY